MTDSITAGISAPQHGPRPLPLFLHMLRSETATDPARQAAALAGLARYQQATRRRYTPAPARIRRGAARLRDHGGSGPTVVFVPSLINPPFVLDLAPGRSLIEHVVASGFHCWLVDWGAPRAQDRALDLAGHVTERLLPMIARLEGPVLLVGYCLGGTLALAAAALLGDRAGGVATIAAPWRFAGYGDAARADMRALWDAAEPMCDRLGVLPMEVLQAGFWRLDPARTIAKYEALPTMADDKLATFVALEDWANTGAPLTYGAGRELFEALVTDDRPGCGKWSVGGQIVGPEELACPAAEFVSLTDRIVPAATAAGLATRHDLATGHVGMVVASGARTQLWESLAAQLGGWSGRHPS